MFGRRHANLYSDIRFSGGRRAERRHEGRDSSGPFFGNSVECCARDHGDPVRNDG